MNYENKERLGYSSEEKIKWLGWYVYRYLNASTGEIVSPKSMRI